MANRAWQRGWLARYERMAQAYETLSDEVKAEFAEWEAKNIDGHSVGTLDWPRWGEFVDMNIYATKPVRKYHAQAIKANIPVDLRWEVWERDNFTCQHCGARRQLRVDHIIPESRRGLTEISNLQTLCRNCNSIKGTRILPFQRSLRT